jgi:hypothetical protein
LKWIYYAPPAKQVPDLWEFDEDGYSPLILYKRIECKDCGATVPVLAMTLDDAVDYWNRIKNINAGSRFVLQKIGEETVRDVEPPKEET